VPLRPRTEGVGSQSGGPGIGTRSGHGKAEGRGGHRGNRSRAGLKAKVLGLCMRTGGFGGRGSRGILASWKIPGG